MILTTRRLVLREVEADDWVATYAYESDPAAVRYTLHGVQTAEQVQQGVRRAIETSREEPRLNFDFAMTLAEDGQLIGRCGFRRGQPEIRLAELWFMANPRWWDQGYVTEAMAEVIRFGFSELDLHRFYGDTDPRNGASARVMEKLGMMKEAHLRENVFSQGEWCDSLIYGLLRSDWLAAGPKNSPSPQ